MNEEKSILSIYFFRLSVQTIPMERFVYLGKKTKDIKSIWAQGHCLILIKVSWSETVSPRF